MIALGHPSRIEKRNNLVGDRIDRCDFVVFAVVACVTGEGQIFCNGFPTMTQWMSMFYDKRIDRKFRWAATIFTRTPGSIEHKSL
jgi:hypothetical protein